MCSNLRLRALIVPLILVAGCSYDSTGPGYGDPPVAPAVVNDGMWTVSATEPSILRLAPAQLIAGGALAPSRKLTTTSADFFQANSVAFDTDGTMWIASQSDGKIVSFPPERLGSAGEKVARVVITTTGASLVAPSALAFDRQHRLWVANSTEGTIVRFDRS